MNTMHPRIHLSITFALALVFASSAAQAQHHSGHGHVSGNRSAWHGDIRHFHERDWPIWHGGHWNYGRHEARVGWWWVVGSVWYFYPAPVYPYPDPYEPPPVVIAPAPAESLPAAPIAQYWYYCETAKGYYPYVSACPGGWKQVPAEPSNVPPAP